MQTRRGFFGSLLAVAALPFTWISRAESRPVLKSTITDFKPANKIVLRCQGSFQSSDVGRIVRVKLNGVEYTKGMRVPG